MTLAKAGTRSARMYDLALSGAHIAFLTSLAGITGYAVFLALPALVARLVFLGVLDVAESATHFLTVISRELPLYSYISPSDELTTTSTIYNPLYYLVLRALPASWLADFSSLRIVSSLPALLVSAILIEAGSRDRFNLRYVGVIWIVIQLALYPVYAWIDLARAEAMFVCAFAFLYFALCRADDSLFKFPLVGLSIVIAFAIKQPAVALTGIPICLILFERRYWISTVVAIGGMIAFVGAMLAVYGPSYVDWAFRRPAGDPFSFGHSIKILVQYYRELGIGLAAPFVLLFLQWLSQRRIKSIAPLFLLCAATFVVAFIPAGKQGGWVTNYVIFTMVSGIAMALILRSALRPSSALHLAGGFIVAGGLISAVAHAEKLGQRDTITPRAVDFAARAELQQIVESVVGDVWITTWPAVGQRTGRPTRIPIGQLCAIAIRCTEAGPAIPLSGDPGPAWAPVADRQIAMIALPVNVVVDPVTALVQRGYLRCFSLRDRHELRHLYGQPYWPSEIWTASGDVCQGIKVGLDQRR